MLIKFKTWTCEPIIGKYSNGRPSLSLLDAEDGQLIAVASINVPEIPLKPRELVIKDYSENQGMLAALLAAGLIEPPHRHIKLSPFVTAPICNLNMELDQ